MQTFQTLESLESMKLSEKTFNLLKNFSSINQSILFKEGNSLRTMSVMKNILAEVEVEEEFPKDFAIYDLVQFLNNVSLCSNPELDFKNKSYVKNAPKDIVQNDKKLLKELTIEDSKLRSIVSSIN